MLGQISGQVLMNTLTIEDGNSSSYDLTFSNRDFALLGGSPVFMPECVSFIGALGVYENTSGARNMKIPAGSHVRRQRGQFLLQTRSTLNYLERDVDLLSFDYSFRLTKGDDRHKVKRSLSGFQIRGLFGEVDGQPSGFCTLTLMEASPTGLGRAVEYIDLRTRDTMETDDKGELKIYREEAEFGWPVALRGLLEFLEGSNAKEIVIHHN